MTVAIIRKLWSGGALFELPRMQPHWFPTWQDAVEEAARRDLGHEVREPELFAPPVEVVAVSPALICP